MKISCDNCGKRWTREKMYITTEDETMIQAFCKKCWILGKEVHNG